MWWTRQADESWDELFDPHKRQGPIYRAIELLDEIEHERDRAWNDAKEVRVPGIEFSLRRTLIEDGSPGLWIYWYIHSEKGTVILDFLPAD
jgi:hypothetical protein